MNNSKNFIWKTISMIVQFIVTLMLTRIIISQLGDISNGFYQLSNDFVNYAMVASIALNSMASRFIIMSYYDDDNANTNKYFNSVLYGDLILGGILLVISICFMVVMHKIISIPNGMVIEIKILFGLMFFNFVMTVTMAAFGIATIVKNRVDLDSKRIAESNLLKLAIFILLLYFFKPHIWYIGLATLLSNIYVIFRNIKYTRILLPEIYLFKKSYFDIEKIKVLIKSGIWNSITKIGSILLSGLDLLIANQLINSLAMGVLSVSKTIPKYVFASITNIASVFTPSILIEYAKNDIDSLVKVVYRSIKVMSLLSIVVETIVIILGKKIYILWLPGGNYQMLYLLSIVAIVGYIFLMPFEVLWTIFTAKNKVKISSIYLICESIIVIITVFVLLSIFNNDNVKLLIIAGTSSFFELIRALIFLPIVSANLLNIKKITFYRPLILNTIALCISLVFSYIIVSFTNNSGIIGLFVEMILIIFIVLLVCFSILFNKTERNYFINILKKLCNTKRG